MRRRSTSGGGSRGRRARRATGRHKRKQQEPVYEEGMDMAEALNLFHQEQVQGLAELGFKVASSLPTCHERQMRPAIEIVGRLMAIKCLMGWVCIPKEMASNQQIQECISKNKLAKYLGDEEKEIFKLKRSQAREEHVDNIGWKFENAWPLAWILGYDEIPDFYGNRLDGDHIKALLIDYAPGMGADLTQWVSSQEIKPEFEVTLLEHTFYCVHNAVRSAQLGRDTVPEGFHPVIHGGVIHERRHALTWALSPGVKWDDTDLST